MRFIEDPNQSPASFEGPSVLDWFKSLLRLDPLEIPAPGEAEQITIPESSPSLPTTELPRISLDRRWALSPERLRVPAAVFLALVAQLTLAQRSGLLVLNLLLYALGAGLLVWAVLAGDFVIPAAKPRSPAQLETSYRWRLLAVAIIFGLLTFLTSADNRFRLVTVISWLGAILAALAALWQGSLSTDEWGQKLRQFLRLSEWHFSFRRWHLILLVAVAVVAFFRLENLARVPYEMWSDQAEKLLDVRDVLQGETKIFFPRNSGREAIEFYWAAAVASVFDTGLSFLTLKIVSASAGLLALPFIYLLGKELGGRRVGLFALLLAGMAFWPNITSRAGLRMPLNEMFVAPAMYFFVRGVRRGSRNDFILSGLAVGLGLQGYSGARVLPLVILVGWLLYLIHENTSDDRRRSTIAFSALVLVSIIGAMPLLRFLVDQPDQLLYRTLTRMGTLEQQYQLHPVLQLLQNMWDSLTMFGWDNGQIWVVTVAGRPALDWITGGFFHLGLVLTVVAYLRRRRWHTLFLLLALPILLLPSALALAFPNENPAPNRVTGAIVPVFIFAAIGLDSLYRWARNQIPAQGQVMAAGLVSLLLLGVGVRNHNLVFSKYAESQRAGTWNTSEVGAIMRAFDNSFGDFDNVYFVVYPYWLDSRLAAIEAGAPIRDYSIWPEDLASQALEPGEYHLYFIKPEDTPAMAQLAELHPQGILSFHPSDITGRDFYLYLVPPLEPVEAPAET